MPNTTIQAYVWPDGSWISVEDVDSIDEYISTNGLSDDYAVQSLEVPDNTDWVAEVGKVLDDMDFSFEAFSQHLIDSRPDHRKSYDDIEWALAQPEGAPNYYLGDVISLKEGGIGIIVKVNEHHDGWPTSYALDPIDEQNKPRKHAWWYELDFKELVGPSALRNMEDPNA